MAKPDRILAQELIDREVMDIKAGEIVGSIVDFALGLDGSVALIGILPLEWYKGGQGITPESIVSVNPQRVCIADSSALASFAPDSEQTFSTHLGETIQGKSVLQEDGEQLGQLLDFSFSLDDGTIGDLIVLDEAGKKVRIAVEALKTIGRDYIVIERGIAPEVGLTHEALEDVLPQPPEGTPPVEADGPPPTPSELDEEPPPAPAAKTQAAEPTREPTRAEEKQALFGEPPSPGELSAFDQKKRDFLLGRPAHRDIRTAEGELIAAKGEQLSDAVLQRIITAGMLGDVFIEMTVNK